MGLLGIFGKKKKRKVPNEPTVVKIAQPDEDRLSSSPSYSNGIASDDFFKNQEQKSVRSLKRIKQSVVEQKVAEMKDILESGPSKPDYRDYDKNPVRDKEMARANDDFEAVCSEVRERESRTRYKNIQNAVETDVDERVEKLADMYDYLTDEKYNRNTADFNEALSDDDTRDKGEAEMKRAEKREKAKSTMPSLTDRHEQMIIEFEQSDAKAKPIDVPDSIPEFSAEKINRLAARFEEQYGNLEKSKKDKDSKSAAEDPENEVDEYRMTPEEEEELKRLKAMFG